MAPLALAEKKTPAAAGTTVDHGTFRFFQNGKAIASETFTIQKLADGSSVTESSLSLNDGKPVQNYRLELTPQGWLTHYEWHSTNESGKPASASVDPDAATGYLTEKAQPAGEKPVTVPIMLPASVTILEDYFVSQRELLLWRYMAAHCRMQDGRNQCTLPAENFGALAPLLKLPLTVNLSFAGQDVLHIKGVDRKLSHYRVVSGDGTWSLWIDEQNLLQRVVIEETGAEILRD
jgi:hypothetical protein